MWCWNACTVRMQGGGAWRACAFAEASSGPAASCRWSCPTISPCCAAACTHKHCIATPHTCPPTCRARSLAGSVRRRFAHASQTAWHGVGRRNRQQSPRLCKHAERQLHRAHGSRRSLLRRVGSAVTPVRLTKQFDAAWNRPSLRKMRPGRHGRSHTVQRRLRRHYAGGQALSDHTAHGRARTRFACRTAARTSFSLASRTPSCLSNSVVRLATLHATPVHS